MFDERCNGKNKLKNLINEVLQGFFQVYLKSLKLDFNVD